MPALKWVFALLVLVLIAAVFLGRSYRRQGLVRQAVIAWLGPPERQMTETYAERSGGPDVDHTIWDGLLDRYVDDGGFVDYEGFAADTELLDHYLEAVAAAPFAELGRDSKLALLINAYNAFTVRLILDHPGIASIRDIPEEKRWDARRFALAGATWSLNELEHDEIRAHFQEPRIHFALVCAAVGCPPLGRRAFVAEDLEAQLEERTRYVHAHPTWFRFERENGQVYLSELYSWYEGDFEQNAGGVLEFVARYSADLESVLAAGKKPEIRWITYDWQLNSRSHRESR